MTNNENRNLETIDIKLIFKTVLRKKFFIFTITSLATAFSFLKCINTPPTWRGSFNVVVSKITTGSSISGSELLSSGLPDIVNFEQNKTQELILSSPSVLMPVYQNVIDRYKSIGKNVENLSFSKWFENELTVKFERATSVLKISHVNRDKSLILETLNLISEQYKEFSKKRKETKILTTIEYLENQIKELRPKSEASQKALNKFSIENGLGNMGGLNNLNNYSSTSEIRLDKIEKNTTFDSNLKNPIDKNLVGRDQFYNGVPIEIINPGETGNRYFNQYKLLEKYEAELIDVSSNLKPNSLYVKKLLNKIENLKTSLKRPTQILIDYRLLVKEARRDESLLNKFENDLVVMKLESNKTNNPWELISIPTIEQDKVHPKTLRSTLLAFVLSFFGSSLISLFLEKKSGYIYEFDEIKNILKIKYIDTFKSFSNKFNKTFIETYLNKYINPQKKETKKIGIISVLSKENNLFSFNDINIENVEFINIEDLEFIEKYTNLLFIVSCGGVQRKDLELIQKFNLIYESKIIGWIYQEK